MTTVRTVLAAIALLALTAGCATTQMPKSTLERAADAAACAELVLRATQAAHDSALAEVLFDAAALAEPCLAVVLPAATPPEEN